MDIVYNIYKPTEDYAFNYSLPFLYILILGTIAFYLFIMAELYETKIDWEKTKCVPKYLFISGYIKQNEGENILSTIYDNFNQCIKTHVKPPIKPVFSGPIPENKTTYPPTSTYPSTTTTPEEITYPPTSTYPTSTSYPTSTYPSSTSEQTIYPPTSTSEETS